MTKELQKVLEDKKKVLKKIRKLNGKIDKINVKKAALYEKHSQLLAEERGLKGVKENGNTDSNNG